MDDVLESIHNTVMSNIQKSLRKGSGWIIDLVIYYNINNSRYNPLVGSSYIKLPKKLNHTNKVWLMFKMLMIMNALNGF